MNFTNNSRQPLDTTAAQLLNLCYNRTWSLGTVESLTGGLVAATIVNISGASKVFRGAIVSYSDDIKINLVGVDKQLIDQQTPYCAQVAQQMSIGGAKTLEADVIISTTGIADSQPDRGVASGTVQIGVKTPNHVQTRGFTFNGNRNEIRLQTVHAALKFALEILDPASQTQ